MSQTLWGVIVGAIVAMVMPLVALIRDNRRWRTEQKLALLRMNRQQLEEAFRKAVAAFVEGLSENRYSIDVMMESLYLFPANVSKAIQVMMDQASSCGPEALKAHFTDVVAEMKIALAAVDREIFATLNLSPPFAVGRATKPAGERPSGDASA